MGDGAGLKVYVVERLVLCVNPNSSRHSHPSSSDVPSRGSIQVSTPSAHHEELSTP